MANRREIEELGRELARAEAEVARIKQAIIRQLGLRDIVGYGSIIKIDWLKIKRGLAPFPCVDEQLTRMSMNAE